MDIFDVCTLGGKHQIRMAKLAIDCNYDLQFWWAILREHGLVTDVLPDYRNSP